MIFSAMLAVSLATASFSFAPMPELTTEQLSLLGNKDFRHAISVAARAALVKKAAKRHDILAWGKAAMPEKFSLPFCQDLHGYMVKTRGSAISSLKAPRGFAKTIIGCHLIPIYQALVEPRMFNFYLNVQANEEKSLSVNRSIKQDLEDNEVLRLVYGSQITGRWTDQEFLLQNGVVFKSVGAGVSLRGLQFRNRRPDAVIVDDIYNEDDVYSREATRKKNDWLKGTLYKILSKSRQSSFHVQGTAINKSDILTEMEKWPGCVSKTFSAITESEKSLWPELYTMQELSEDKIRMGTVIYNREMMNKCQDDTEALVKSTWLQDWEYDPKIRWSQRSMEVRITGSILGCDPSTGSSETGDPAGFCVVVETQGPGSKREWWIEQLHNASMSWEARLAQLERMQAFQNAKGPEFRIKRARIEGISGFADFANQAKVKTGLPVEVVTFVKGKLGNLASKAGHFEFGRIHISSEIPLALRDTLKEQLTTNQPKHDDLRDALLLTLDESKLLMRSWV
jgi:hypothetical protein